MRRTLVVALIGAVAFAAGTMVDLELASDDSDAPVASGGLPAAVEETRAKLEAKAEAGDYAAVAELVPAGFRYTFGDTVEGGPVAYWQNLERTSNQRPLERLAAILKLPYVLSRGYYVWPWAYTAESADDLSPHERELLAPLGDTSELVPPGAGYLGWRAGIAPDGTWSFYVAGD